MSQDYRKARARERAESARKEEARATWEGGPARWLRPGAAGVVLVSFVVYLLTLYPSVSGGDSGELITVSYKLGVAHPPGYPLYTLLGKFFTLLPFGTVGWRVNLLSATCDALAAGVLFLAVAEWARSLAAGVAAAGLFAFSPLIWHYAIRAEVFALNNLFVALLLYSSVMYYQRRELRFAYGAALVAGFGLAHHQTFLFPASVFLAFVVFLEPARTLRSGTLLRMAALGLVGFLPYIYLPIGASRAVPGSWGDERTLDGFLTHLLRREYGTFRLIAKDTDNGGLFHGLWFYFGDLFRQSLWVGPVLAAWGAWCAYKEKDRLAAMVLGAAGFYLVVFQSLSNLDLEDLVNHEVQARFWQQADLLVFALAGFAVARLPRFALPAAGVLAAVQLGLHYRASDQHRNTLVLKYDEGILSSLPKNALLLSTGDIETYGMLYAQQCEDFRTDVRMIDRQMLAYPWMKRLVEAEYPDVVIPGPKLDLSDGYTIKQLLDANIRKFRILASDFSDAEKAQDWTASYRDLRYGFVHQIVPKDLGVNMAEHVKEVKEAFTLYNPGPDPPPLSLPWEYLVWKEYWEDLNQQGLELAMMGRDARDPPTLRAGIEMLESIVRQIPNPVPNVFMNLGIADAELAVYDPAAKAKSIEAFKKFLEVAPESHEKRQLVTQAIANLEHG